MTSGLPCLIRCDDTPLSPASHLREFTVITENIFPQPSCSDGINTLDIQSAIVITTRSPWQILWLPTHTIVSLLSLLYPTLHMSTHFSSVQSFSRVWHFWPHELQHARPPCPSPSPRVHSNSRPSSGWCHSALSSPVVPFSSCPQSFPGSESFPRLFQVFAWGGQSTGVSALASFLPKKSQGWSPSEWTGWVSLQSKGLSRHSL